jgi:hypothetical protein
MAKNRLTANKRNYGSQKKRIAASEEPKYGLRRENPPTIPPEAFINLRN